ncbi:MAG: leucine-rich repeat domain-containing protein, partial [Firmicutes bacterium]|nr:leucine-rich repeat domain-containing protein [Bacillota bacterium]
DLKLPYCTTSIGAYAFFEFYRLKGLSFFGGIPTDVSTSTYANNLKSIGSYAFSVRTPSYMSSMTYDVTLNAGIQSIGKRAFNQRKDIKNFNFDSTSNQRDRRLSYIGDYAFYNCVNLKTCNVADSNSLSYLGMYAFAETTGLSSSITVGGTLNTLSEGTFYNSKITSCTLTSYVRYINAYAFYNCTNMTSLYLNGSNYTDMSNIYVLGDFALAYCSSLASSVRFSSSTFSGGTTTRYVRQSGDYYYPDFYATYSARTVNSYSPSLSAITSSSILGLYRRFNLTSGNNIIQTYRKREGKENRVNHYFNESSSSSSYAPYWYNGKVSTGLGFLAFYNTQNLRFHTDFNNSCGATGVSSYTFYGSSLLNDKYIDTIFPQAIGGNGMIASHAFTTGNGNTTIYIGNSSRLTLSGYVDPYGFDGVTFSAYNQTYYNTDVGNSYTRSHPSGYHLKISFTNNYVTSFIFAGAKAWGSAEIVFTNDSSNKYLASFALYDDPFSSIYIDVNSTNADVYFYSFSLLDSSTRSISANGYCRFYAGMAIGSTFCASEKYSRQMTDPGLGFYGRRTDGKDDGKYYYGKNGCGGYGDECNNDGYMYAMALYNELNYIPEGPSYSVTHDDKDGNYRKDNLMLKWYGNNEYNSFDVGDQKDNNVSETYYVSFRARNEYNGKSYSYSMRTAYSTDYVKAIGVRCDPSSSSSQTGYN